MTNSELKTEQQKSDENKVLSATIIFALDVEQAFKLYSYRIIPPKDFQLQITNSILQLQKLTSEVFDNKNEEE